MGANLGLEPSVRTLLVFCGCVDDRETVRKLCWELTPVQFCANASELASHGLLGDAPESHVRAVVFDIDTHAARAKLPILIGRLRGTSIPLLLRLRAGSASIRAVVEHAHALTDLRVSLRQCDLFAADLARLLPPSAERVPTPSARLAILAASAAVVPGQTLPILAMAAAVGAHSTSVRAFADACGLHPRTLEVRLATAGTLAPKLLLQWMVALHATWHICVAGAKPSNVAVAMGLPSAAVLSDRVERVTGWRLRALCADYGFECLLDQFVSVLVGDRHRGDRK